MCEKEDLVQKNLKRTLNKSPFFELKVADFELDFHQFRQFGLCVIGRSIVKPSWLGGVPQNISRKFGLCVMGHLNIAKHCEIYLEVFHKISREILGCVLWAI